MSNRNLLGKRPNSIGYNITDQGVEGFLASSSDEDDKPQDQIPQKSPFGGKGIKQEDMSKSLLDKILIAKANDSGHNKSLWDDVEKEIKLLYSSHLKEEHSHTSYHLNEILEILIQNAPKEKRWIDCLERIMSMGGLIQSIDSRRDFQKRLLLSIQFEKFRETYVLIELNLLFLHSSRKDSDTMKAKKSFKLKDPKMLIALLLQVDLEHMKNSTYFEYVMLQKTILNILIIMDEKIKFHEHVVKQNINDDLSEEVSDDESDDEYLDDFKAAKFLRSSQILKFLLIKNKPDEAITFLKLDDYELRKYQRLNAGDNKICYGIDTSFNTAQNPIMIVLSDYFNIKDTQKRYLISLIIERGDLATVFDNNVISELNDRYITSGTFILNFWKLAAYGLLGAAFYNPNQVTHTRFWICGIIGLTLKLLIPVRIYFFDALHYRDFFVLNPLNCTLMIIETIVIFGAIVSSITFNDQEFFFEWMALLFVGFGFIRSVGNFVYHLTRAQNVFIMTAVKSIKYLLVGALFTPIFVLTSDAMGLVEVGGCYNPDPDTYTYYLADYNEDGNCTFYEKSEFLFNNGLKNNKIELIVGDDDNFFDRMATLFTSYLFNTILFNAMIIGQAIVSLKADMVNSQIMLVHDRLRNILMMEKQEIMKLPGLKEHHHLSSYLVWLKQGEPILSNVLGEDKGSIKSLIFDLPMIDDD